LVYINNNFIESVILKWSYIYGNIKNSLHYRKSLNEPKSFKKNLLKTINFAEEEWRNHWGRMKTFRDKQVPHIDPEPEVDVPDLDIAFRSVTYFYESAICVLKSSTRSEKYQAYYNNIERYTFYREKIRRTDEKTS